MKNLSIKTTNRFTISQIKKHTHFIQFDKSTNSFYDTIHNHDLPFIVRSLRLRQACTIPNFISKQKTINYQKLDKIINKILPKSIIFTYFRHEIQYLYSKLSTKFNVAIIDGTQTQIQRNITINDHTKHILLIQVYAGSTG